MPLELREEGEAAELAAVGMRLLSLDDVWTRRLDNDVPDRDQRALLAQVGQQMITDLEFVAQRTWLVNRLIDEARDNWDQDVFAALAAQGLDGRELAEATRTAVTVIQEETETEVADLRDKIDGLGGAGIVAGDLGRRMKAAICIAVGLAIIAVTAGVGAAVTATGVALLGAGASVFI